MDIVDNVDVVEKDERSQNGRETFIHVLRQNRVSEVLESKNLMDLLFHFGVIDRHNLLVLGPPRQEFPVLLLRFAEFRVV